MSNLKAIYAKEYRLRKSRYIAPKQEATKRTNLAGGSQLGGRKSPSAWSIN